MDFQYALPVGRDRILFPTSSVVNFQCTLLVGEDRLDTKILPCLSTFNALSPWEERLFDPCLHIVARAYRLSMHSLRGERDVS